MEELAHIPFEKPVKFTQDSVVSLFNCVDAAVQMDYNLFLHSLTAGHFGHFHLGAIINKVVVAILYVIFGPQRHWFLLDSLGGELLF